VYKRDIPFLPDLDLSRLYLLKAFLEDADEFDRFYLKADHSLWGHPDFVFRDASPAFHRDPKCPLLLANYENYKVPEAVKDKGGEEVERFRLWAEENRALMEKGDDLFLFRMNVEFGLKMDRSQFAGLRIERDNSGPAPVKSLFELEERIDELIERERQFCCLSPENMDIALEFGKMYWVIWHDGPIWSNRTMYPDSYVRKVLRVYVERYVSPAKSALQHYVIMKANPELSLEEKILAHIGFRACRGCAES